MKKKNRSGSETAEELKNLARELKTFPSTETLDAKLETSGGISMPKEKFLVFCEEYKRRGVSLPQ